VKRDFKKSVSPSLVYRALKIDRNHYVGFKVTYSGKGNKSGNFDKRTLSIILIPDVNFVRSYRPFAGAIARATRAEVICCAYQRLESREFDEKLIESIVMRVGQSKSKLRKINMISENPRILETVKTRMHASMNPAIAITTPTELLLEEAPLSSPDMHHHSKASGELKKKKVTFFKISRKATETKNRGIVKRMFSSVVSGLGKLFGTGSSVGISVAEAGTDSGESPVMVDENIFECINKNFEINHNINLINPNHCDLVANMMMTMISTK